MSSLAAAIRNVAGACALAGLAALSSPISAQEQTQQPATTIINPTAQGVTEQQLLQQEPRITGRIIIPDKRAAVLIQPAGREWRAFHEIALRWIAAIAILGMLAVLVAFYLTRGMVRLESGRSGRTIVRFNGFERFVHWMTATCFILLGLSGLNITFGKKLLMPLIGHDAFSTWSVWAKYAHNYLSFPFTIGVVLIFLMWLGGNIPDRTDIEWLKRGGGIVGHKHPPADRFNAGQKAIYWIVVLGGAAVAISGYVLIFPFYGTDIGNMHAAHMVHSIVAVLFFAVMLAHIYIGTIGMEGAFEAMGKGTVDVNWAKEHHKLWLEKEAKADKLPEQDLRSTPAE
ncbi:formate dehydrogenase subunit gamma [Mesorhizobium soli]|uniref:formate dehydrogenase subunit gamma n=1 Tax=Pseudaminobacter soli (ex Li et al. 2025) TaxID=1295366 RepID=UPI00247532A8|nr:formate dehydrogenase subunit gamma [Mesorhizobium soli]MDH6231624.1 formate dehydrogenase subunit gamma [Mesorhizobium soli]